MADFYGGNSLIYEYSNGSIMSGGYKINSPIMLTHFGGEGEEKGEKIQNKNVTDNLVIPIGLINFNIKNKHNFNILNSSEILSNDLYDNLLNLVNTNPKLLTKKNRSAKHSNTRKNKFIGSK